MVKPLSFVIFHPKIIFLVLTRPSISHVGLDPAGPCYTFPCVISKADRLDAGDADKVQCIHTNIGLIGTTPRCGCEDFYLNLGIVQPGAVHPVTAHYFVTNIFDWTLNRKHQCNSFGGELIGIHSQKVCGFYHVDTNARAPYCKKVFGGLISDIVGDVLSRKVQ